MSSFLVDTNIFVFAADAALPENAQARDILQQAGDSANVWWLGWQNVFEFLSVVTNPKAFQGRVLSLENARAFIDQILEAPNVRLLSETADHWKNFLEVTDGLPGSHGPFLHDCRLATLLKEHNVKRVITADSGFKRFSFLTVINPFDQTEFVI